MRVAPSLVLVVLLAPAVLAAAPLPPPLGADNDAGSGRDAPNAPGPGVAILPGVVYEAALPAGDGADWYEFQATQGDALSAYVWTGAACIAFLPASGGTPHAQCGVSDSDVMGSSVATSTGTWRLGISPLGASTLPYRFSLGVNGVVAEPAPHHHLGLNGPRFIQPGEQVTTPEGLCTLNFAFDGVGSAAGKVYIGTAAHCFTALGQEASIAGLPSFGHVVYLGDYAGINTGTFENGIPGAQADFSLIEVGSAYTSWVRGEVKGHPGLPTALLPHANANVGARLDFSGYGTGWEGNSILRESRSGVLVLKSAEKWNGVAPITPGDSGGPVLYATGEAVGTATDLSALGAGGVWLDVAIAQATQYGFPIQLRTA